MPTVTVCPSKQRRLSGRCFALTKAESCQAKSRSRKQFGTAVCVSARLRVMAEKADVVMVPTQASVDEFLDTVEPLGRREDAYVLREMLDRITGVPAVMWGPSIVGYGRYHYRYESGREGDSPLIGFSPRKASMSLYLQRFEGSGHLLDALGPNKRGASCVWVGRFNNLDLAVLELLYAESWRLGTEGIGLPGVVSIG